ncbi:MAG: PhnD/SsuA/transferrin family substrate-binding protein, partial [Firmicutes bacterium]|nr:PhnD/SsuA/transferrin family substrate-binding protein [Bacillota bacterium]
GMGLVKLMNDADRGETLSNNYTFTMAASADEITPQFIQGNIDIACVPANLASVLYNKTEGNVQVLAINTYGILYIVENGDTVNSVADLKGKTIYASGKGATPEYALRYVLSQNGIDPDKDVTIEWKSEHAECVSAIASSEGAVALLPQPFVTTAQMKNGSIRTALDLTEEWEKLGVDSSMVTGVAVIRKDVADANPGAVKNFLEEYKSSVDWVNANAADAAALIENYDIVKAAVAEKAIPACHIVCTTGKDMKSELSGYLSVLAEQNPAAVGGKLPDDDFYFGA